MKLLPTKSALLHLRFMFSLFLLPVFVFALSQAPEVSSWSAFLVFVVWHFFVYPASNGYNSYFDKDEGSIALIEKPPAVDKSLYNFSLLLEGIGVLLALLVSLEFAMAAVLYGVLSKMYSHPSVRLKAHPYLSFLVVFIFQGAFIYWASYAAISELSLAQSWSYPNIVAGLTCSCLIGASYPLTQVYQHEEDLKRGDRTLSLVLGVKGTFVFAGCLFALGCGLMFHYWELQHTTVYFWLFLVFVLPVMFVFLKWLIRSWKDRHNANFKFMSKMTMVSGLAMLGYFLTILILRLL
ncbi:UbiA family prenyltransferase [Pedobacter sp. SYSU D00535]|uniref:UbiA family prenyltransferase n=1 Tax=Pedobacter sp. SYSU D00535 TaxID=2810308 RepID=UPI001A97A3EC|nr:UbiA family prenyltransferase [Pedobacter sp. SYSU D00535]